MALALQEGGIGHSGLRDWIGAVPAFRDLGGATVDWIVAGMLERGILWDEAGVLWLGREGQDAYGRKNFLDLVSVFTAPPLFAVLHGRCELGSVDQSTFLARRADGPPVLLLAGRAWRVTHLDWKRRRALVEPAEDEGRSRWRGQGQFLAFELCRAIRRLLADEAVLPTWSRRAVARIESIRSDFPWLAGDESNVLCQAGGEAAWWTFAGGRANTALAADLGRQLDMKVTSDNFAVKFPPHQPLAVLEPEIRRLADLDPGSLRIPVSDSAREELKFVECLPIGLANRVIQDRLGDPEVIASTLARTTRVINADLSQ
jgi:ATP-dependent Lhr-like helicase